MAFDTQITRLLIVVAALGYGARPSSAADPSQSPPPNIVLIFADDKREYGGPNRIEGR